LSPRRLSRLNILWRMSGPPLSGDRPKASR
jgi:hypothetical protein